MKRIILANLLYLIFTNWVNAQDLNFEMSDLWKKSTISNNLDAIKYSQLTDNEGIGFDYTNMKSTAYRFNMLTNNTELFSGYAKKTNSKGLLQELYYYILGKPMLTLEYWDNGNLKQINAINYDIIQTILKNPNSENTWMDSINKIYSLHLKDTLTASNQLRQLKVNMMLEVVRNDDGSYKSKFPFTLSEEYSSTGMLKSRTIGFFNPSELSVEPKSLTVKEFEFKRFFYFDNGKVSSQLNMNTDFYLTEFSIVNYQKLHLNGTTDFEAKYNQNDWTEYIEYDPNRPEIKKCILDFKKSEFYGSYDSVLIQKKLKTILADEFRFIQEQHKCIINGHISNSNEIESLFGEDTSIYTFVEIDAEYPGGDPAMMKYIYHDHLIYPPSAIELGIQGKVALKFVVEKNGQLSNISLVRGIPGCTECDKEAQRVVSNMPNWKPAKNNGIIVRQWIFLPIRFLLKKF